MEKEFNELLVEIKKISKESDFELESDEIIQNVHSLRNYWKPKKIKIMLLAESHVWTGEAEYRKKISSVAINKKLKKYPLNYSRFIYCLGYGENKILEKEIQRNNGTPQFWKIFYSLFKNISTEKENVNVLKTASRNIESRLENKINLLEKMKKNGIWLQDASPVALYKNGKKPPIKIYKAILESSWNKYLLPQIKSEKPDLILIIGKGVHDALETFIKNEGLEKKVDWVHQPQGARTKKQIFEMYNKIFNHRKRIYQE